MFRYRRSWRSPPDRYVLGTSQVLRSQKPATQRATTERPPPGQLRPNNRGQLKTCDPREAVSSRGWSSERQESEWLRLTRRNPGCQRLCKETLRVMVLAMGAQPPSTPNSKHPTTQRPRPGQSRPNNHGQSKTCDPREAVSSRGWSSERQESERRRLKRWASESRAMANVNYCRRSAWNAEGRRSAAFEKYIILNFMVIKKVRLHRHPSRT